MAMFKSSFQLFVTFARDVFWWDSDDRLTVFVCGIVSFFGPRWSWRVSRNNISVFRLIHRRFLGRVLRIIRRQIWIFIRCLVRSFWRGCIEGWILRIGGRGLGWRWGRCGWRRRVGRWLRRGKLGGYGVNGLWGRIGSCFRLRWCRAWVSIFLLVRGGFYLCCLVLRKFWKIGKRLLRIFVWVLRDILVVLLRFAFRIWCLWGRIGRRCCSRCLHFIFLV